MLAPIIIGGFHKVAFPFCNHPRGTPQDTFFAEVALFYRILSRDQVLKKRRTETIPNIFLDWSTFRPIQFLNLIKGKGAAR
ncbi:MAG: hypothetical protein EBW44_15495 [Rhodobacteraceae bacterium]|nr:hypothetical protein [Paracoccaceae bacterium]